MPKVSVIIPVYNVEQYLQKCLDSVVNQTFQDIEIIIVNDGSPDNSQKIIDEYKKKYPEMIRSYIKKNGGLGSARNFGLKKAKGEYILFVDSDDYIEKNMLELLNNIIKSKNPDIIIFNDYIVNEKTGEKKLHSQSMPIIGKRVTKKSFLFKMPAACTKIYKTSLIKENKIFFAEGKWYEDIAFFQKTLLCAKHIELYNEPLYNYVIREGSIMNNNNYLRNLEILDAFDDIISFYKKNDFYKKHYEELEFLAIYHIYIRCFSRIIKMKGNFIKRQKVMKRLLNYLKENFRDYKKNVYLKNMDFNKKTIYLLLRLRLYFLVKIIYLIKK